MSNNMNPGKFRRWMTALGGAVKQGVLGKSSRAYLKQIGASDGSWNAILAHHSAGPPGRAPLRAVADSSAAGPAVPEPTTSAAQQQSPWPAGAVFEPVHGWTRRQSDAYLARNPGYHLAYDAELRKHPGWPTSANGFPAPGSP